MAYVLAFIALASFLDLVSLTVLMWAVLKDSDYHDTRIFRLELVEKTLTEWIEKLQARVNDQAEEIDDLQRELERHEEAHS
jgi:peptidoglycan hydrolase CwlO-like protein